MRHVLSGTLIWILLQTSALATTSVDAIIQLNEAPEGVVFEIATARKNALKTALPKIKQQIKRLQARFPELSIAVVSHGNEQFALQKNKKDDNREVHEATRSLVESGVPVHVCGTYAGWRGLVDEDFPEFVNVSATGPAQINDYKAVGYLHVIID